MEKRQLQKTGGASFTVTLPKWWIEQHELQHKDIIEMHVQQSGSLLLRAKSKTRIIPPVLLTITNHTPEMITREAIALYIGGADEIEFQSPALSSKQRLHIRHVSQRLIGFEIIDESAKKIVIKNIFDQTKLPVPDMLEKMILASRSMLSDANNACIEEDRESAKGIIDRDLEIDKLYLIINRQFHSVLDDKISEEEISLNRSDLNYYRTIALQLERMADHAVKIAETVESHQENIQPEIILRYQPIITTLLEKMNDIRSMTKNADANIAHKILNAGKHIEEDITAHKKKTPETSKNMILADSLNRIRSYIMNTAEATIDHALRQRMSITLPKSKISS